jgi:sirohydrochlorin ferrochelatase
LLLVAHGSTGAEAQDVPQVRAVRDRAVFAEVAAAFLKGKPSLSNALAGLRSRTVCVVPLLMSDGTIAAAMRTSLAAAATRGRELVLARPIGLSPRLHEIMAAQAQSVCRSHSLKGETTHILLVAHGAKSDGGSRQATLAHAARLRETQRFAGVAAAFLEEPPLVPDALAVLSGDVVAVGLFAGGTHAECDVPALIEAARPHRAGKLIYAGAVGADPGIAGIIVDEASHALSARG